MPEHSASDPRQELGGTTCLTVLVYYSLSSFLRHDSSNVAN